MGLFLGRWRCAAIPFPSWKNEGKRRTYTLRGPRYGAVKTESMLVSLLSLSSDGDASSTTASDTFDNAGIYIGFTHSQLEELVYIAVSERDRAEY